MTEDGVLKVVGEFLDGGAGVSAAMLEELTAGSRRLESTDEKTFITPKRRSRLFYFPLLSLRCFERRTAGNQELRMAEELRLLPAQLKAYQEQAQT